MDDDTEPMGHEEAERTNAVERYLLNELTEQQRTRFEEHYFECATCANGILAGQALIEGLRKPPAPWWKRFVKKLGRN